MKGYELVNINHDVVEVLKMIRSLCCRHSQSNNEIYAEVTSRKSLLFIYQKPEVANNEYLKDLKARVELIDNHKAYNMGKFPCLFQTKMKKKTQQTYRRCLESEVRHMKKW